MVKFGFFEKSTIAVPSLDSDSRVLVTDGYNDHILLLNTELQLLPWCLQLVVWDRYRTYHRRSASLYWENWE